jgi:hypothetical protein
MQPYQPGPRKFKLNEQRRRAARIRSRAARGTQWLPRDVLTIELPGLPVGNPAAIPPRGE